MSENDTCGGCVHWKRFSECFRFPPVVFLFLHPIEGQVQVEQGRPTMPADEPACGEFSQRPFGERHEPGT